VKIGVLQLNSTIGDYEANARKLLAAYEKASGLGAEFIIAPELFLCGYPPRDLVLREDFIEANLVTLAGIAKKVGPIPLCVGYLDRNTTRPGKALTNSAAVLYNGHIVWRVIKSLLPTYDVFDEDRYFEPAKSTQPFEFNGRKLGITICEDIWNDEDFWPERLYRRDPVKELVALGADLILNVSASPWCLGKDKTRLAMLQRVARDERVPLVLANLIGGNDELIFDGSSVALNRRGEVVHRGKSFEEDVFVAEVDGDGVLTPALSLSVEKREIVVAGGRSGAAGLSSGGPLTPALSHAGERESATTRLEFPSTEEQLFRALSLGIRDYVQKCGFRSVIVGLSGGIDSAITAVLAVDALGADKVLGVSMPSRYSSPGSLTDAEALATNLGIRYEVLSIEIAFKAMESQFAKVFAGLKPNEAEENIQSRLRGVTLMALSNKFGSLVLTTGNKSEMAVGYCTLYGDMSGALAVIGDVFKTDIYKISRWVNREKIIIPEASITKPPSAELRPDQKDQDSLPPYETLDAILQAYVVENQSKRQIIDRGFNPAVVNDVINKVTFSEYKRRQAAPGLKVSPRAFGMGRRIPIAQRFRPTA